MYAKALQLLAKGAKSGASKAAAGKQRLAGGAKNLSKKYLSAAEKGERWRKWAGDKEPGRYGWMSAAAGAGDKALPGSGKYISRFASSGAGKSFGSQIEQSAVNLGIKGGKNVLKYGGKAAFKLARAAQNPLGTQMSMVGKMYGAGAKLAGAGIGTAANIVGSKEGAAVGNFVADDIGKVAKNFSDLAKNPLNPAKFVKLAESIATLPAKFISLGESLVATNEKLAPFSGQIATATFNYKKDELARNIQSAQRTGGTRALLSDKISDLKDTMQPLSDGFTNFLNTTMSALTIYIESILETAKSVLDTTNKILFALKVLNPIGAKVAEWSISKLTFGLIDAYKAAKMEAEMEKDRVQPLNKMMSDYYKFSGAVDSHAQPLWQTQSNNTPSGADPNSMLGNTGVDLK